MSCRQTGRRERSEAVSRPSDGKNAARSDRLQEAGAKKGRGRCLINLPEKADGDDTTELSYNTW